MAVTHADLAPRPKSTDLSSKAGVFITAFTILCGLFCFVLCLIAEATRSEVTWTKNNGKYECVYNSDGRAPLLSAACAFVGLAIAVFVEHTYMLIAVSKSPSSPLMLTLDPNYAPLKSLTWQAGFFFVTTWVCFAVGEILLLIGVSVESGHLKNWKRPEASCLVLREGLFSAAGFLALATVFLAAGLYLTALRVQRIYQELQSVRREVLATSAFYASPPRSPHQHHPFSTVARENPTAISDNPHLSSRLHVFPTPYPKINCNADAVLV